MDTSGSIHSGRVGTKSDTPAEKGLELIHPDTGMSFRLNQTGAALWNLAVRRETVEGAVNTFQQAFPEEPASKIASDVRCLVQRLLFSELITVEQGVLSVLGDVRAATVQAGDDVEDGTKDYFDKYWYYHDAVQSPDIDAKFYRRVYREVTGGGARLRRGTPLRRALQSGHHDGVLHSRPLRRQGHRSLPGRAGVIEGGHLR